MPIAIICGATGQDGSYLAEYLLKLGYEVHGTSRFIQPSHSAQAAILSGRAAIPIWPIDLEEYRAVDELIDRIRPDEVYNLSGLTSVSASFSEPLQATESIVSPTSNLLESLRLRRPSARLFSAASTECFGDTDPNRPVEETTALRPKSPYGVAKAAALMQVANYREAFGLFACSGILSNHESSRRPPNFVFRKIVSAAAAIARGGDQRLALGNTTVIRDWGWAPEYVDAMWRMLQQETPRDYVIATGESHSLSEMVQMVFAAAGLDWRDHVDFDDTLIRPLEIRATYADPRRAWDALGWQAETRASELVLRLMAEELAVCELSS